MAGIVGIIRKSKEAPAELLQNMMERAVTKLSIHNEVSDLNQSAFRENVVLHVSVATGDSVERKILDDREENGVLIALDGEVFIDDAEKSAIRNQFPTANLVHEIQYLPFLYKLYGRDFREKMYGHYNILFYDPADSYITLFNDRFGYLPLYYYDHHEYFMFASKIESILQSGIMTSIHIDPVSVSEHLLFHYTVSDHTYIQGIHTFSHAIAYTFSPGQVLKENYWEPSEFFGFSPLGRQASLDEIDLALDRSIRQIIQRTEEPVHFSLTGGWDSRVILSYLLSQHRDQFRSYSFGAPGSDDTEIPRLIANQEKFSYQSYLLDSSYLTNHFVSEASDTIQFSNGTRNYKRAHYLYAIRRLSSTSPNLLSGIFGDEVFKVGMPQGGTVIASSMVKLLQCNFDRDAIRKFIHESHIDQYIQLGPTDIEELITRISEIGSWLSKYERSGERYFAFRFCLNLRKYFGSEVNSYNDFVNCFSPFIDYPFLKSFSKTAYMISNYEFKKTGIAEKYRSSRLYYELVRRNFEPLSNYRTSRGFTMRETGTLPGMANILLKKYIKKRLKRSPDAFNTDGTDQLFRDTKLSPSIASIFVPNPPESGRGVSGNKIIQQEDLYSLSYWLQHISETYEV